MLVDQPDIMASLVYHMRRLTRVHDIHARYEMALGILADVNSTGTTKTWDTLNAFDESQSLKRGVFQILLNEGRGR